MIKLNKKVCKQSLISYLDLEPMMETFRGSSYVGEGVRWMAILHSHEE